MLYIGYPVSIEEAYRLLGMTITKNVYYDQLKHINVYCKSKNVEICVHPIGRYCVMLSYKFEEINDVCNKHVSVTSFVAKLQTIKEQIKNDLETLGVDISNVLLTMVEGEEYIAHYPEPIVWNWVD